MRTGLVLGAGGVVDTSWLIGALEALCAETGWDPSRADRIVGTSAGSVVGCLIANGIAPGVPVRRRARPRMASARRLRGRSA